MARGRYLAFLDSDDYWCGEKLARQVAYLEANPLKGLVHTGVDYIYMGEYVETDILPFPTTLARNSADCLRGDHIIHMTVMGRREIFDKNAYFDESDRETFQRAGERHQQANLEKKIQRHTLRPGTGKIQGGGVRRGSKVGDEIPVQKPASGTRTIHGWGQAD
jgi:glycosyltransferase involved in cell wall biosynthesis